MALVCLLAVAIVCHLLSVNSAYGRMAEMGCNVYKGQWVYDPSYPLYNSYQCPFISTDTSFDCQKNGRPDKDYMKYRWQPQGSCKLSRFDGVDFLAKMKGKRLMFVGDSISIDQYYSLICLIHAAVPRANYTFQKTGDLSNFTLHEYDVSLMMLWNAYLVDILKDASGRRMLNLNSISTSNVWGKMDVLIFNTWYHFAYAAANKPWDLVVYGNTTVKDMDIMTAYKLALRTWAKWIDGNIDTTKARIFFQGVSPDHYGLQNCTRQMQPLKDISRWRPPAEIELERVLNSMLKPVHLLDITSVSRYRIDGHPSFYLGDKGHIDCTHWCLSGVPDIWNEFLLQNCTRQTQPLEDISRRRPTAEIELEKVLNSMSKPVHLLDITSVSQYRIDGHPSFYLGHPHVSFSIYLKVV